jgi:dTDP-4-amino-4,6-dideoxygalactose transaminase
MEKDEQLEKLQEELFERRNIDKKYRLALKELERLD